MRKSIVGCIVAVGLLGAVESLAAEPVGDKFETIVTAKRIVPKEVAELDHRIAVLKAEVKALQEARASLVKRVRDQDRLAKAKARVAELENEIAEMGY
jgi:uncharacterized small protein (DUF1192 family)